jgi:hypothetical protein
VRRPQGYATIVDPGAPTFECDTITCSHCNRVVMVDSRMRPEQQTPFRVIEPERCRMCMLFICPTCVYEAQRTVRACVPFERKLDMMEKRRGQ